MPEKIAEQPFAAKKFIDVDGHRMAYIDEGEGSAMVFQHGNPTSFYLWRNVMPHLAGQGQLIACDLMGMGDSEKLDPAMGLVAIASRSSASICMASGMSSISATT